MIEPPPNPIPGPVNWKQELTALARAMLIAGAVFLAARFGIKVDPQVLVLNNGTPVAIPSTDCGCEKCPNKK